MIFAPLALAGAFRIEIAPRDDDRGFFARSFCAGEMAARGLDRDWPQANLSFNRQAGTLRGLHLQRPPGREAKLVRCVAGAAFDVLVDLRPGSATFGQSCTLEISAQNRSMVHVPAGVAHGFQTLAPDTELFYMHSEPYTPELDAGLNPLDAALAIDWPLPVSAISRRDAALPALSCWKERA